MIERVKYGGGMTDSGVANRSNSRLGRGVTPEVISTTFGLAWILGHGGLRIIDPRDTRWLMCGDWAWHHLGWLFYQRDAWHLPLGAIQNYPDPWGTTTVYTDSVPGLAMVLKLLPLPNNFQYLGLWIVANFCLSGFWGARLVRLFTKNSLAIVLGSIPFVVTPILLLRTGHAALSAHWLLLWALHIYLRPTGSDAQLRGALRSATIWGPIAAGIHVYLLAMGIPILWAFYWRVCKIERRLSQRAAWLHLLRSLGAALLTMTLLGHFNGTGPTSGGYGKYVADVLTFVDPMGWSRILPALPTKPGEIGLSCTFSGRMKCVSCQSETSVGFGQRRSGESWMFAKQS